MWMFVNELFYKCFLFNFYIECLILKPEDYDRNFAKKNRKK